MITIGDELLIGQVVNRNASWISERCTEIGARVVAHSVIGDEEEDLVAEITRLGSRCAMLLLTGGLGPTHDDITKWVLCSMAKDTMVVNEPWLEHLRQWMERRGREVTPRNAGQAEVPSQATVLHNPVGTAPGLLMTIAGTLVVSMPGVPREMKAIMENEVLPRIRERVDLEEGETRSYRTLLTTGIAESNLADLIGEPSEFLGSSTLAFLPNLQGVRLRIGALGRSTSERDAELDRIATFLYERAGRFVFGEGAITLSEAVGNRLKDRGETLAVAESCTGGLLGGAITDVPGSSSWFPGGVISYANEVKVESVGVRQDTLDAVGAVSEEVAIQMGDGIRQRMGTTWGIGVTGVAGPGGGSEDKPVGTVWIGLSGPKGTRAVRFQFGEERRSNRERSVGAALGMLWGDLR